MEKIKFVKEYKHYPEMVDSGIEWLGMIPKDWEVNRASRLFDIIESGQRPTEEFPDSERIPSIGGEHINWEGNIIFTDNKFISKQFYNKMRRGKLKLNDILLVKDGATIGKVAIVKEIIKEIAINEHVFLMRTKYSINNIFVYYILTSQMFQSILSLMIRGSAQGGLQNTFSKGILVSLPDKNNQEKITKFLNNKISKIDRIIELKERLIELLKEKREAIINQAVTKGLDPNVEMVDSGIEWLGMIPKGWEVKKLKYVSKINPSKRNLIDRNLSVSFIAMEDVDENGNIISVESIELNKVFAGYKYFKNDDVIFAKITPCFENGKGFIATNLSNSIGFGSTEFTVLRPSKDIRSDFLFHFVKSYLFRKTAENFMQGTAGQKRVPESFTINFRIAYPHIVLQEEITKELKKKTFVLDKVINNNLKTISLFKEYKQSLITNAVTGKIMIENAEE